MEGGKYDVARVRQTLAVKSLRPPYREPEDRLFDTVNFAHRVAPRDPGVMCDQVRAGSDIKADTPAANHAGLASADNVSSISLNGYRKTARECRFLVSAPGPARRLTDAGQG